MRLRRIPALFGISALLCTLSSVSLASENEQSPERVEQRHEDGNNKGDHKGGQGHDGEYRDGERIFRTNRGLEYYDCEIIGRDPHGVTFRHRGGVAKLAYADLPKSEQTAFGYDRDEAEKFVRRHHPLPVKMVYSSPHRAVLSPSNATRQGALAAYPRRRGRSQGFRNPYALNGSVANIASYGSVFGGYMQPYFAGRFGTPRLVTSVPGGFFTPTTLRVSGRPIVGSPIAPGLVSFSQVRDARAAAVRASVRATPRRIGVLHRGGGGHYHGGGHHGGGHK